MRDSSQWKADLVLPSVKRVLLVLVRLLASTWSLAWSVCDGTTTLQRDKWRNVDAQLVVPDMKATRITAILADRQRVKKVDIRHRK